MNAPATAVREQASAEEWRLRVELAACYRLIALERDSPGYAA